MQDKLFIVIRVIMKTVILSVLSFICPLKRADAFGFNAVTAVAGASTVQHLFVFTLNLVAEV